MNNKDDYDLINLVKAFLVFSEELLEKKVITKALYDEMTYSKMKFLNDIDATAYLMDERTEKYILEKNI
ncbi:hypothetical protein [Marinisporobacter balticus]|uniref:Uncharacterized protein n=1 Tax=Marinisporobacter balticus TaxID=2018667 RepID=A0A4R2KWI2_9FIRM|nr:hypothetical protein [Marinisporobacter balticus]TCO74598.1 hypothetical protein EV214_11277 [Marinisporobacter balticus]